MRLWGLCHRCCPCYGGTRPPLVPPHCARAFGKDGEDGKGWWLLLGQPRGHLQLVTSPAPPEPGSLQPGQPSQSSLGGPEVVVPPTSLPNLLFPDSLKRFWLTQ